MPQYGKIAGAGIGAAAGSFIPGIGTMVGGALGGLFGGLFDSTDAPEWENIAGPGVDAYGQDVARDNMSRYGFQGVYQKFLQGENTRMKDDEQRRIMKLSSNLTPGMASFRGGLASQGLGGATSNVMAKQQREEALGKALDIGTSAYDASSNRLDTQFLGMTERGEGMRFGASQDLMKATGMQTNAQIGVDQFNTTGRMGQRNMSYQADQKSSDQWNKMFGSIAGDWAGMSMYKDKFPGQDPSTAGSGFGGNWGKPNSTFDFNAPLNFNKYNFNTPLNFGRK